jgi:hypothetical protein
LTSVAAGNRWAFPSQLTLATSEISNVRDCVSTHRKYRLFQWRSATLLSSGIFFLGYCGIHLKIKISDFIRHYNVDQNIIFYYVYANIIF